ncbi:signal peptidase II [Candidatus Margulisiibacteriota bacterium]
MFFVIAAATFLFDRSIKFLITLALAPAKSILLIRHFLSLTYVKNYGAAFGLFSGSGAFLITVGIIISVVIIFYYFGFHKKETIYKVSLGLILGGSLGNLYDRVFLGYVVDYIDIGIFPVFNFADMMINLGILLLILKVFIFEGSK